MILTLITITVFILGVTMLCLCAKDILAEAFGYIGLVLILLSTFSTVGCIFGLLNGHTYLGKSEVVKMEEKRTAIVSAMNDDAPVTVKNQLYSDIAEYNAKVRNAKHWANSPWTNWFYPKEWNELEYIKEEEK
jgi:hypothetical protein